MDNHPLKIHMNTISNRGRYGNIDKEQLNYGSTSSERLLYCLDGRPGSIIDELEGEEEEVENAARYLSENYGEDPEDVFEVEGPDSTLGFVALYPQEERSHEELFEVGEIEGRIEIKPVHTAYVFNPENGDQVDIKIE